MVASILTGGGLAKLYSVWQKRNQPAATIHLTESQAKKTDADARLTHIDGDVRMNAIVEGLYNRVEQMQMRVDTILAERDDFHLKYDLMKIELKMARGDVKKAMRLLEDFRCPCGRHGISYSEADKPRG